MLMWIMIIVIKIWEKARKRKVKKAEEGFKLTTKINIKIFGTG